MKKWNNPELKNLDVGKTNEAMECTNPSEATTLDDNHWVGKECHHKLIVNGKPANAFTCGYAEHAMQGLKPVIRCKFIPVSQS